MAGNAVTEAFQSRGSPVEQRSVLRGYISTLQPAPTGFPKPGSDENLLWVILPEYSTDRPLGPCQWSADHGTTLPAQGAAVVITVDAAGVPTVVWWEGRYTEPKPTLVSALPSEPTDGQEVYFQNTAMAALGLVWTLRYRAASASTHKWEFIGGGRLLNTVVTEEATGLAKTTYGNLGTVGPQVTVPLAGEYQVSVEARIGAATETGDFYMSFEPNGESPTDANALKYTSAASYPAVPSARNLNCVLPAGTMTAKYKTSGAGANFSYRTVSITPIRVG